MIKRFKKLKPAFWEHKSLSGNHPHTTFNFARKWKLIVLFTSFMALLPLFVMTLVEFGLTRQIIEEEVKNNIAKIVNLASASLTLSIDREKVTIDNIVSNSDFNKIKTPGYLETIKKTILSCSNDILNISTPDPASIFDSNLISKTAKNNPYLTYETAGNSTTPRLLLITSYFNNQARPFFFKIQLDKAILIRTIAHLIPGENNDIFIIDEDKTLLSTSFYYGYAGTHDAISTVRFNKNSGIEKLITPGGESVIAGYAKVPNSSLIFVLIKSEKWLTSLYFKPRLKLVGYLIISIIIIILSIMGTATYLVSRIHAADRKRVEALQHVEYANKLASIGRLAAGVAHEVNNPLAIINQKTGLILDLFTLREDLASDERLIPLANDVLDAVKRCGTITQQLLDFARHTEFNIQPMDIGEVIRQVLAFLQKEAEHRHLDIVVDIKASIKHFECDRGSLQQIFLNLFENAFAAMEDGGRLEISVKIKQDDTIIIRVSDNGHGIADKDIDKIFEPFYSSKNDHWGTGLGLSITYGLIKELGGDIMVKSEIGKGTRFTILLPMKATNSKRLNSIPPPV